MGVIAQDNKQMNFYYSEDSSIAKQALGYLEASDKKIQLININETKLTGTQWAELSQGVGTTIDGLISKDHPSAKDVIKDGDFDEHDWIDILNNCPQVFEYPVAMNGSSFLLVLFSFDESKENELAGQGETGLPFRSITSKTQIIQPKKIPPKKRDF